MEIKNIWTLLATGISFTAIGIYDVIASRGRHVGWPILTGIGLSSLIASRFA